MNRRQMLIGAITAPLAAKVTVPAATPATAAPAAPKTRWVPLEIACTLTYFYGVIPYKSLAFVNGEPMVEILDDGVLHPPAGPCTGT